MGDFNKHVYNDYKRPRNTLYYTFRTHPASSLVYILGWGRNNSLSGHQRIKSANMSIIS